MKSPKCHDLSDDRTVIDIKDTAEKHQELSKYILQLHALTGADCIPDLFKIGKKRALNTLICFKSGFFNPKNLAPVGDIFADIEDVIFSGSKFFIGFYGKAYAQACNTLQKQG